MDSIFFSLNFPTSQLPPFICVFWGRALGVKNLVPMPPTRVIYLFIYIMEDPVEKNFAIVKFWPSKCEIMP